jgi:thiamine biosynthesis lipoprotein
MGSPLRLTLPDVPDVPDREAAWREVVDEFEAADAAMSRFRDSSELTRLNRLAGAGCAVVVSGRLRTGLITAERARRVTDGRFDPRVLDDLDRLGYSGAPLGGPVSGHRAGRAAPHGPAVRAAGRGALVVDHRIDLGGIGKGLTLRWAAARLERLGCATFLLEAGGDLVSRGRPPDADAWTVGIEDPTRNVGHLAAIVSGPGSEAIATSSIRINHWRIDDRAVHHIVDPATGEPGGSGLQSVTVAGPDSAWAEVWSKVLFLSGADAIVDEARARGIAAWWVDGSGTVAMTPAARSVTAWAAGEA